MKSKLAEQAIQKKMDAMSKTMTKMRKEFREDPFRTTHNERF